MTLKYLLPVLALTASASVMAEDYQLFTELNADRVRVSGGDSETLWNANGTYYFDKKQSLGPLDQFEYINKESNISAGYSRLYGENVWTVGGEAFVDENVLLAARYSRIAGENISYLGLGYLFSDNFIVRADATIPKHGSASFIFSASYDLQLDGNDYVGFTATVDDNFDYYTVGSKYFASVGQESYVAIGGGYADNDGRSAWYAEADYYFTKMTSVGVQFDREDDFSVNAKHFFDKNWALTAGYGSNFDTSDVKVYSLSLTGQF